METDSLIIGGGLAWTGLTPGWRGCPRRTDLIGRAHNTITQQVAKQSACDIFSISDRITAENLLMTPPLS